jgi:CheY-like chemotaxis protein
MTGRVPGALADRASSRAAPASEKARKCIVARPAGRAINHLGGPDHARRRSTAGNEALVLAVDDGVEVRALVRNALEPGVRVATAADAEEALLRAWELGPDLVVADLLMPGMDGAAFAAAYQEAVPPPRAPIIVVTAAPDAGARASQINAAGCLAKPFRLDALYASIAQVTGGQ